MRFVSVEWPVKNQNPTYKPAPTDKNDKLFIGTMVKITNKKTTKNSPISLLTALGILGVIVYYISAPDDSSVGNLLNVESSAKRSSVGATGKGSQDAMTIVTYVPSSTSGLQPVRCEELFRKGYRQDGKTRAEVEDLNPNNDQINARFTNAFASKFWISVHHQTYDKLQYDSIMELGFYKKQALSQAAVEIVQASGPGFPSPRCRSSSGMVQFTFTRIGP